MIRLKLKSSFDLSTSDPDSEPRPIAWFPREQLAFQPPSKLTVPEWAANHRLLQAGVSRQPGPWSNEMTSYLLGPMEEYTQTDTRHIVLCFGTQIGKTECLYNMLGFIVDQDPYSTLLVYPREDDSKTISRTRIQPMIDDCPTLRARKPARQDLYQLLEMHFPGMILYLVGANSPAALAQKPCRNILRDEIDKYPEKVGKDADPLSLSEERAKSFWDIRKIVDVSSPTLETIGIWKQLQSCDVIRSYHVPCPHCGHKQKLRMDQVKWEKPETEGWEGKIQLAKETAHYECEECETPIGSEVKLWQLQNGEWFDDEEPTGTPTKVGFHLSSLYSPWLTWADVAEKYLQALKEKEEKQSNEPLQNFINGWLAEPWIEYHKEREEHEILSLCDDRPRGNVPVEGVLGLTAGIDTQQDGFYYVVRAWGEHDASWLVREGFIDDFDAVLDVVMGRFSSADQTEHIVSMAFQDSAGGRTAEVYEKLRGMQQIRPTKGEQRMATPYAVTRIDTYPGSTKPIPGGLSLYRINTTYYKDRLNLRLAVNPADPGAFRLHSEVSVEYCKHMTAEYKDDHGVWQCPEHKANHWWDCEVLAMAAADVLGIRHWARADPEQEQRRPAAQERQRLRRASRW